MLLWIDACDRSCGSVLLWIDACDWSYDQSCGSVMWIGAYDRDDVDWFVTERERDETER